jgi:Fic family protein
VDKKTDAEPDIKPAEDLGERLALMEPMLIEQTSAHREQITDLALVLAQRSSAFRHSLPESLLSSLANLVRSMNCYYSNLIEGHYTHPIDIERALKGDYSQDPKKRGLQLEAKAHIEVQQWIDSGGLHGRPATSFSSILEIHRRFCELLPDELLWVEDTTPGKYIRVIPGALRQHNVAVGKHIPVSSPAVPRFLERFEQVYNQLGKTETIIAVAAAHHRLVWIHPFLDGNGRVARLMSHAMLLDLLDTGGIWSIARGLGRNANTYKSHLANCDQKRRNDLDGRGNLSEEALVEFTKFFLSTCLDQVSFMQSLMRPELLRNRVVLWADEEIRLGKLPPKSNAVLEAILYRGELPRAETANITGTGERQARRIVSALLGQGVLVSESPRSPLRLAFPASLASRWMPGLFPEAEKDLYARSTITPTGSRQSFVTILKVPKAKIKELRQDPMKQVLSDAQLISNYLVPRIAAKVYPVPGGTSSVGSTLYPEGLVPPEIQDRTDSQQVGDVTYWLLGTEPA